MRILLATLLFCFAFPIQAQEKPDEWTPEDIINTEYVSSPSFSSDNQMVLWSKRKPIKKKDAFVSDLYLTRLNMTKDGAFRTFTLTQGEESNYNALLSKNGEYVYFLSSREKGKKLWRLSLYGGEPEEVHTFENGISSMNWLNEHTLAFVSNDGKTLYEQEAKKRKDNTIVVEDEEHWTASRLYAFDLQKKAIKKLTNNTYPLTSYSLSRDGKWAIGTLTMSRHYASDAQPKPKVMLYDLERGTELEIAKGLQTPFNFQFTDDNQGCYFVAERSSDPQWNGAGISELYYFSLDTKRASKVNLDWEWGLGRGYQIIGNNVLASLANGPLQKSVFYAKSGDSWKGSKIKFEQEESQVSVLEVSKDGKKILYRHSNAAQLPEYYVADLTAGGKLQVSNPKKLVSLNASLKKKPITKYEVMRWKGANDEEVTGILYYPMDYKEGEKYPLMLSIHGGPSGVDRDTWSERWSTYPQILAQKGAFILKPNYHGSSNHGQAFVESIKGHYYDLEMVDIMKGIDALKKRELIDSTKMGTMGWSNGAILTTMLTVRYPDMFKVACAGAGDVNWTSDFGTCRFGVSFDQSYFGGAPWDNTNGKTYNETYILKSPLFEMEKVKTPTIIFHGSADRAVPRDQGWEYYRSLQQIGKAPVRFLWFPDQPHGLRKITHQLRKMKEEINWIDKYLFGKTKEEENPAFKKESPLGQLIALGKAANENGTFGVKKGNALIPEVVATKKDSLQIGRFEITNAQFNAFDKRYYFPPQEANHPVMVDYAQAQAYIQWLNVLTDDFYRLPSEEEAKKLQEKAAGVALKENTINYWSGYDISPDEAPVLRKKLIDAKITLLMPVGSFKPVKIGNAPIYDLGGNVAEYMEGGKCYGYGANDFVDTTVKDIPAKQSFKGFRVVKD